MWCITVYYGILEYTIIRVCIMVPVSKLPHGWLWYNAVYYGIL